MYRKALDLSDTVEDSRLVLAALAGVADLDALALAQAALDEPELGDSAALAVIAIAEGIGQAHRDEALDAIHGVLQRRDGPELRRRAGVAANRIEADDDFVTAWLVAGPFAGEGAGPTELFDIAFAPEQESAAQPVTWARLAVTNPGSPGIFNLGQAVGGGNRCVYVRTHLWSDRERTARLELGSDDGIKAWLNGGIVHAANALRGLTVGSDRVDVDLREGPNTLLLKITQGGGDWSFCCRVRDPLGFHADGVRLATDEDLASPPAWEGPGAAGFVALFDGRTLEGWRRLGGRAEYRVEDGQIVGTTRPGEPNSFLCTERQYEDFVLELEFRVDPELNSGIQIRSNSFPDYHDGRVHGYQVEIDPSQRAWSGGIYDEARRGWLAPLDEASPARQAFRQDGWNRLRIVARGDTLMTWLNGVATARLVDSMTPRGFIGLQVHGVGDRTDPLEVRWRDIRIRELDDVPAQSEEPR